MTKIDASLSGKFTIRFAGAHSDVGGGYHTRELADIPLVWMARQAERLGLALDWSCLPDPETLDASSPTHDSSSGLFALDHYRPTLRAIGDKKCSVALNESLYRSVDENGKPLATINERVHRGVVSRYGMTALTCSSDLTGTCEPGLYQPKTLKPYFDDGQFAGLPIED